MGAARNIAVRLFQQRLVGEEVIAETRSGADGRFSLAWPAGVAAGLTVRADGSAGKDVSSKTALSSGVAWVRLSVGGGYRGSTRWPVERGARPVSGPERSMRWPVRVAART